MEKSQRGSLAADRAVINRALRESFNRVAGSYTKARPSHPAELVTDLVHLAGIGPTTRVLEIGPGTGQLTIPLAETGAAILAVELGPSLAAIARERCHASITSKSSSPILLSGRFLRVSSMSWLQQRPFTGSIQQLKWRELVRR
jgi:predicted RNA methylase